MDISDIFIFFLFGARERGEAFEEAAGRRFFIENTGRGGGFRGGGAGGEGRRGNVCGEAGGGGLNIFFRARNAHKGVNVGQRIGHGCLVHDINHTPNERTKDLQFTIYVDPCVTRILLFLLLVLN